jgi:hypothetical protein
MDRRITMSRNLDDIINELSPASRKKAEARAAQLIAEETIRQAKVVACELPLEGPRRCRVDQPARTFTYDPGASSIADKAPSPGSRAATRSPANFATHWPQCGHQDPS